MNFTDRQLIWHAHQRTLYRRALKPPRRHWLSRILRTTLAVVVVLAVLVPIAGATGVATWVLAPLPASLPRLADASEQLPSTVYAADGTQLATLSAAQQRVNLSTSQIPETAVAATLASEDHRFFTHDGVDLEGLLRAGLIDVRAGHIVEGGSTITQQLIKNRSGDTEKTLDRKLREALAAIRLERAVPKREILTAYLNTVYYGEQAFGLEAASRTYFGHPAATLSLSEAALLASVLPSPSAYSPYQDAPGAERRRLALLDSVARYKLAPAALVVAAKATPPVLATKAAAPVTYPYFVDYVRTYLLDVAHLTPEQVFSGGLRIETTIDPRLQADAEIVVASHLPDPADPEGSLVAVEPRTGYVRALVGGRNYAASQVNLALGTLGGGSGRQPGSAFKPFVLAAAFNKGITPKSMYSAPASIQPPGFAKPVANYDHSSHGRLTVEEATWDSVNTVFVQLIQDAGIAETANLAHAMGITTVDAAHSDGSLAIGTYEVSPLDMASAYSVFANRGNRAAPAPVVRVVAPTGRVLVDNSDPLTGRVLSETTADTVTDVLTGVVTKGTGKDARLPDRPTAGKTGTTDDYVDAWFAGYVPQLATAVWVGYPQGRIPLLNVEGVSQVAGGTIPASIWHDFMALALADTPPAPFESPLAADAALSQAQSSIFSGIVPLGQRRLGRKPRQSELTDGSSSSSPNAPQPIPLPVPATLPPTTTTTGPPSTTTTTTGPPPTTTTTTGP